MLQTAERDVTGSLASCDRQQKSESYQFCTALSTLSTEKRPLVTDNNRCSDNNGKINSFEKLKHWQL